MKFKYNKRYFIEVSTLIIINQKLFEISCHKFVYDENIFHLNVDNKDYALTPMNCPKHMPIYNNTLNSYRELPIRLADDLYI